MAVNSIRPQEDFASPGSSNPANSRLVKILLCVIIILLIVIVGLVVTFLVLFEVKNFGNDANAPSATASITGTLPSGTVPANCQELKLCDKQFKVPPLLIISSDGFANSYLDFKITPTIQRLFDCGSGSTFLRPVFPSKTFPNHYSIVTGLYPGWHGIVDNKFYDKTKGDSMFRTSVTDPGWYKGRPIWKLVQDYGLKSGAAFWPGSEAEDQYPDYYHSYNTSWPYQARVDQILTWLNMDEESRPSLMTLYFDEPDYGGHIGGAGSPEVQKGMVRVEEAINYLISELIKQKLIGCMNIVFLSDHGMQTIDYKRTVILKEFLPDYFNGKLLTGVTAQIIVDENEANPEDLIETMKCKNGTDFILYSREKLPTRYHYSEKSRIGDYIIEGKAGVFIMKDINELKYNIGWNGNHGFDNRLQTMRALFTALGPSIAEDVKIPPIDNIELFNFFCDLLSIDAPPNNGTRGLLYPLLKNPPQNPPVPNATVEQCLDTVTLSGCSETCPDMSSLTSDCTLQTSSVVYTMADSPECVIAFCDGVIHFKNSLKVPLMVETTITTEDFVSTSTDCLTAVDNLFESCIRTDDYLSLFINKDKYNTLEAAKVPVVPGFIDGPWSYLVDLLTVYVKTYNKLSLYVGTAYDSDGNGVADSWENITSTTKPSHIYVVLYRCKDSDEPDRYKCQNPLVLTFILPILEEDFNCLPPEFYLFKNTARLRDVELISGFQFFTNSSVVPFLSAARLRTELPNQLWAISAK